MLKRGGEVKEEDKGKQRERSGDNTMEMLQRDVRERRKKTLTVSGLESHLYLLS